MCDRIKWWSSVIYLSTGYVISVMISKGQRLKTLWQNNFAKKWWCTDAYNNKVMIHYPRRYSVRGHFVGFKVQSDCLIQEVARVNTKDQLISPFRTTCFEQALPYNTKIIAACSLFMDTEVCVAAFVTGAHLICVRSGQNSIYLINTNYSARWPSQWLFIMHEGAHNPN